MDSDDALIIAAARVATMEGAVIEDGGVLIAKGRIVSLGRAGELRQKNPRAQVEEFSDSILTPGLVNAHTHLELSDFKQCPAPSSFGDWLMRLVINRAISRACS